MCPSSWEVAVLDRFGYFRRCMGCAQARGSEMKRKRRPGRLPRSLLSVGTGLVMTDSSALLGCLSNSPLSIFF